jgi:hypothetical protein
MSLIALRRSERSKLRLSMSARLVLIALFNLRNLTLFPKLTAAKLRQQAYAGKTSEKLVALGY